MILTIKSVDGVYRAKGKVKGRMVEAEGVTFMEALKAITNIINSAKNA
jgi:hypothetical protein